jgi:hypothetical protein
LESQENNSKENQKVIPENCNNNVAKSNERKATKRTHDQVSKPSKNSQTSQSKITKFFTSSSQK